MENHWFKGPKALFIVPALLLLMVVIACGTAAEEPAAAPTEAPAAAPTAMMEQMEEPTEAMMAGTEYAPAFSSYWNPPTDYYGQPVYGGTTLMFGALPAA